MKKKHLLSKVRKLEARVIDLQLQGIKQPLASELLEVVQKLLGTIVSELHPQ